MKKFIAPLLTLTMVFSTAIAVSAAPNVSGSVSYKMTDDHTSNLETKVNFGGQLNANTDYLVTLKKSDSTATFDQVYIDEASLTNTNKFGQIQFGQFKYNPTVMDIMDTTNFEEMKTAVAVKITPNLGENLHFAVGYQPNADGAFGQDAVQAELDYKFSVVTLGVNYQDLNQGGDAGLVWQAEIQPVEYLKIYGEYGNKAGSDDDQGLVGALLTNGKLGVRGEYNTDNDDWGAKLTYNITNNISTEFEALNGDYNELNVKYTF